MASSLSQQHRCAVAIIVIRHDHDGILRCMGRKEKMDWSIHVDGETKQIMLQALVCTKVVVVVIIMIFTITMTVIAFFD